MKKSLAVLAITIAGLFCGGAALALTGDSASHDQSPATTDSSTSNDSTESTHSESESTESESSESTESESSESTESESSESTESQSTESSESQSTESSEPATHEHPANHGADVSKAAHECPEGPGHRQCVSAVAHEHG
jgi:hypothetical protein